MCLFDVSVGKNTDCKMAGSDVRFLMMRASAYRLLLLGILPMLIGCWGSSPSEPIMIGLLLDASYEDPSTARTAARLALKHAGVSENVQVLVESTENTPEGAAQAALRLINQKDVVGLIGPNISSLAIAAGAVAERGGVTMISPASTHPETTAGRRYSFRATFVDSDQGAEMAYFAYEELRLNRVALVFEAADSYSQSAAWAFRESFLATGGEVVVFAAYAPGSDQDDLLRRVVESGAEALFLPNNDDDAVPQARRARELGFGGVILGSDAWAPNVVTREEVLDGAYLTLHWHLDLMSNLPAGQAFTEAWRQETGEDPGALAALTYDAAGLLAAALTAVEDPEREAVRDAFAQIEDYVGVSGVMSFQGREGNPRKAVIVGKIAAGRLQPTTGTKIEAAARRNLFPGG